MEKEEIIKTLRKIKSQVTDLEIAVWTLNNELKGLLEEIK